MMGELAPYSFLNDDIVMLLFILNITCMAYVFSMNGASIAERAKSMFYNAKQAAPYNDRTHITKICNLLLYAQTILNASIVALGYMQYSVPCPSNTKAHIAIALFFTLITIALFAKRLLYDIYNTTLISSAAANEWRQSYFFTIQLMGFVLLPLVVCIIFVKNFSKTFYLIYLLFATTIHSIAIIKGASKIIFNKKHYYLDIFLYLCALELLPMAFLWKTIHIPNAFLIIKF